ncbi:MAG TPA: hypothetical protein DCF68_19790, partial [Cyanothece sp. UBA12306]|nr:hypothetical protein [Cyanothece sp. UBA12306]
MDEQRTQAYLNLINQLLTCNQGDEPQVLQENQELLDKGLIEVMIAVAQQLEEAGRENKAQFLMNIAQQLAQALGLLENDTRPTENTFQDSLNLLMYALRRVSQNPNYLDFLIETLQKISKNPNPQVIYPFLAQNLDKLDDNLRRMFLSWAMNTIFLAQANTKKQEAEYIADVIVKFSDLMAQFPLGNIAMNQEIAITGYEIALRVFTFEAFPQKWAMTQNNLAAAYLERIRGD